MRAPMLSDADTTLLLNALPGLAYRCSTEAPWNFQYVSPGVWDLCGAGPDEFVSGKRTWASVIHPDDLSTVEREVDLAVSQEREFSLTYRILDRCQSVKWVFERGQAAFDDNGRPIALVGFISDITEQKWAEHRLKESEDHYRAAVELNPQIPWTAEPDGKAFEAGPQWLELLGSDRAIGLAHRWQEALHPDDRARAVQSWQTCVANGSRFDARYRLSVHDGSYRWMRARASPRLNADGAVVKWYGTLEDISEQVDLEDQLRSAEERYALAARATGDLIWDWNVDLGTVRRIDPEETWLGHDSKLLSGASLDWWFDQVHPNDVETLRDSIETLLADDRDRWSSEYRFRRGDGRYAYVIDRGYLLPAAHGEPRRMVGAVQDISERREAKDAVSKLEMQLLRLSQRTAITAVAATVAHELNQPLSAAANWIAVGKHHLVSIPGRAAQQASRALLKAGDQVARTGEIVRRMRDIISEGSARRERASLKRLVKNVRGLIKTSGSYPALRLTIEISDEVDLIEVDPIQIEELILNLISNACQAVRDDQQPRVTISASASGSVVTVRVRDNGRGIPADLQPDLFSRFGESTTGGLGVGLSIARTMVQAHGGSIWATNNETVGASIWFTVPRAPAHS